MELVATISRGCLGRHKNNIMAITDEFAPIRQIKRNGRPPWWTSRVSKAQARKRQAWKRFLDSRGHSRLQEYIRERDRALKIQKSCRINYEQKLANKAKLCPKAFFNYVQASGKVKSTIGTIIDNQGDEISTSEGKAEVFKNYFEKVHVNDTGTQKTEIDPKPIPLMEDFVISPNEVEARLRKLKMHKSAGPDDIHPAILKPIASTLATPPSESIQLVSQPSTTTTGLEGSRGRPHS